MLRRRIYGSLLDWKARAGHKCLLVRGRRRVGKTYTIDLFGRSEYGHYVYVDLSRDRDIAGVFDGNLDVDSIVNAMAIYRGQGDFVPCETLLFLDEIQACPCARESLKSFTMDGRFDVIASGSLLDANHKTAPMIPVGYEEHMTMHSLDFEEFLWARGVPQAVIDDIRSRIRERVAIPQTFLKAIEGHFRDHMAVGGMPEAVEAFLANGSYADAEAVLDAVIESSRNNIRKYNDGITASRRSIVSTPYLRSCRIPTRSSCTPA